MAENDDRLARLEVLMHEVSAKLDVLIEALAEDDFEEAPRASLDGDILDRDRNLLDPL